MNWIQQADGWHADGYLIQLAEPFRWVLVTEDQPSRDSVSLLSAPLATTRTLTECKREAELLAATSQRRELLRRWTAHLLLALSAMAFTLGLETPWNAFLTFGLALLAIRSVGLMLGIVASRYGHPSFRDVFFQ